MITQTGLTFYATCDDCSAQSAPYATPRHAGRALATHRCDDTCAACRFRVPIGRGLCRACREDESIFIDFAAVRTFRPPHEVIEDVEDLVMAGASADEAAFRLGMQRESIRRAMSRHGRLDLYRRLVENGERCHVAA